MEVQNYTSIALKKNFIRFGGRMRYTSESNTTTNGTNGIFTYNSVADYIANNPSQFSITKINSGVNVNYLDGEFYAEDDWKVRPNLTFSYGLRYEVQNFVSEHHDFSPRLSFAYGLGSAKGSPKTVLRGGFGIFYDRFQLANQLTVAQQNGVNQVRSLATFTGNANGCSPDNLAACQTTVGGGGNQVYTASPALRSPYTMQFALGADQQLFRGATISVNYLNARGVHQFISENVNAPVQGTPIGSTTRAVVNQFQSEADFRQNQLLTNFNLRGSRYFSSSGSMRSTSPNPTRRVPPHFPRSRTTSRRTTVARASTRGSRLFLGGNVTAPHYVSISPFIIAASGTPYNVTTRYGCQRRQRLRRPPVLHQWQLRQLHHAR